MPELSQRCLSMKSKTLSLKTIIKELYFLKKTIIIQWNAWNKKDLLLLANKLIEKKYLICTMLKDAINHL